MNRLQKYFKYRQSLIDQYVKGDMTKREYLSENLNAVLALQIKPFKYIDTPDKALYNYQYYNALAKEAKVHALNFRDEKEMSEMYREKSNYYYQKKDKATLKLLELIDYKGVEAYFVRVHSKHLRGKLFELVIYDYYNMILHSSSEVILNRLKDEGVFQNTVKQSLIDGYINQKY